MAIALAKSCYAFPAAQAHIFYQTLPEAFLLTGTILTPCIEIMAIL
jgi:hypothetical protein